MIKRNTSILLVLLIAVALLTNWQSARAQEPAIYLYLEKSDSTAFPNIELHLSAWDANGLPLTTLQPEDLFIREENGVAFHPEQVQADTQSAVWVALVLDISGSMQGQPLTDARTAAARFLDRLGANDRAALIAFSDPVDVDPQKLNPQRELGFTSQRSALYDTIENLRAGGNTHLYNAVSKAVGLFNDPSSGHRAILVLSDGRNDPETIGDPDQPIRLARQAHIPVFVIGLGKQIDEPYLRRLANETGGLFRAAPSSAELARLFSEMATLLKTQYRLTYQSRMIADGQSHPLEVQLVQGSLKTSAQLQIGPLPKMVATAQTPTIAFPFPTNTLASTPTTASFANVTTSAPPPATSPSSKQWIFTLTAGIACVAVTILFLLTRRQRTAPEACARCGYDLTGRPGACPQCGETRRLPGKSVKSD